MNKNIEHYLSTISSGTKVDSWFVTTKNNIVFYLVNTLKQIISPYYERSLFGAGVKSYSWRSNLISYYNTCAV